MIELGSMTSALLPHRFRREHLGHRRERREARGGIAKATSTSDERRAAGVIRAQQESGG